MLSTSNLHNYQHRVLQQLSDKPEAAVMADMGTGKTIMSLTEIAAAGKRALVIAPLRVAQLVWNEEAARWEQTTGLKVGKVIGTPVQRKAALASDADVLVTNYENLQWLVDNIELLPELDVLYIDELSRLKGRGAWYKAAKVLRWYFREVRGLTGTPAPNGYLDLFGQMDVIKPGLLGRNFTQYRRKYFYADDWNKYDYHPKVGAIEAINKLIEPYVIRVSNDELDMPELVEQRVRVILPVNAAKAMRKLRNDGMALVGGEMVIAESQAVATNKITQLANGTVYAGEDNDIVVEVHSAKLKVLKELAEEMQGENLLVAYQYDHDLRRLQKMFPEAITLGGGLSDEQANRIRNGWNAGQIPMLLGHPASMGHGLNIQQGGHHIVMYGLTWDLEQYQQLVARLARQGQEAGTVFVHLLCAGELDEVIADALIAKASVQQALLDYFARTNLCL